MTTELTANQKKRIDAALFIAENIDSIDDTFPEATLNPDSSAAIKKARSMLASQLARIDANSSKYVVTGPQKSGKTTFLNALIGLDVLPTGGERCTYAITSLRVSKGPFQLTVRPKFCSSSEFKLREAALERAGNLDGPSAAVAARDLARFRLLQTRLEPLISGNEKLTADGDFEFSDRTITDIELARACLKMVAATEIAFAIQEIEVDISAPDPLITSGGVLELIDLPGLDSGLIIHRDLARAAMKYADAIIFVQNILTPTHQEHVATLLDYADEGDVINFREKIFVFLSHADEKTDAVVNDNYDSTIREWRKHEVDSSSIFVGSAAGQLMTVPHDLSGETLATLLPAGALPRNEDMSAATGSFLRGLKESMAPYNARVKGDDDTGFRRFIARLEEYRAVGQPVNVARRIDESLREIKSSSRDFVQTINSKLRNQSRVFDVDTDEDIIFQIFLESYVDLAKSSMLEAIHRIIGRDIEQNSDQYDMTIKNKIDAIFNRLYYMKEEHIDEIARPHKGGQRDVIKFQMTWRELLFREIENSLREMGDEIGSAISGEITDVLDQTSNLMFRNEIVEKTLIGTRETYDAEIRAAVNALLMQFAKPLIITAIRPLPLTTTDMARTDALAQYKRELKAFSQFYMGRRPGFSDVHSYLAGNGHANAAGQGRNIRGNGADKPAAAAGFLGRFRRGSAKSFDAKQKWKAVEDSKYDAPFELAKQAVRKDIDLCQELLANALARAAGLSAFRLSQFEMLERRFSVPDSENKWKGAVQKASRNPGTKADVEKVFLAWQKKRTQHVEHLALIFEVLKHHNEL